MTIFKPTFKCKITGQRKPTVNYYMRHSGRRYPLGVSDRRVAEAKARELVARLELGHDPAAHEKAKREPLAALVAEFAGRLAARAGARHRESHQQRLGKLIAGVGARALRDLEPARCEAWLAASGLAARTRHHYVRLLKQFGRFLADTNRVARNPFAALPAVTGIEQDRRLTRRALADAEIDALVAAVPRSRYRRLGLAGPDRAALYKLLLATGLRRDEAASLTPESFRLDDPVPHVVVEARHTKNKQPAHQPLPAALAGELRGYLASVPAGRPVWPIARKGSAHMVRIDLAEAGVAVEQNGRVVDLHALRTTFGTLLARRNVPLALAQKLMRHCDPRLTSNIYTVAQLADLSREVEKLADGR